MIVLVQVRGEGLVFKCKGGPLGYCRGAEGEVFHGVHLILNKDTKIPSNHIAFAFVAF